jgi:hypothetical protein
MRLVRYSHPKGLMSLGLVVKHPHDGQDWVFDPALTMQRLGLYASRGTSPLHVRRHEFGTRNMPGSITGALIVPGFFDELRQLHDFLLRFLEQADTYILMQAGWPLNDVRLLAPIPEPRLFFGLVQNSPTQAGDVVTLGRLSQRLHLPLSTQLQGGTSAYAEIDGIGRVDFRLLDQRTR